MKNVRHIFSMSVVSDGYLDIKEFCLGIRYYLHCRSSYQSNSGANKPKGQNK